MLTIWAARFAQNKYWKLDWHAKCPYVFFVLNPHRFCYVIGMGICHCCFWNVKPGGNSFFKVNDKDHIHRINFVFLSLPWTCKCLYTNHYYYPPSNYLFKVNNRKNSEICSNLTTKTLERCHWRRQWRLSSVFIVNFEHISLIVVVFLLLTLNK